MSIEDLRGRFDALNSDLMRAVGTDAQLVKTVEKHMGHLEMFVVQELERAARAKRFSAERAQKRAMLGVPEPTSPRPQRESADDYFLRLKAVGLTRMTSVGGQSMVPQPQAEMMRSASETTTGTSADDSSVDT